MLKIMLWAYCFIFFAQFSASLYQLILPIPLQEGDSSGLQSLRLIYILSFFAYSFYASFLGLFLLIRNWQLKFATSWQLLFFGILLLTPIISIFLFVFADNWARFLHLDFKIIFANSVILVSIFHLVQFLALLKYVPKSFIKFYNPL